MNDRKILLAYVAPFALFMLGLAVKQGMETLFGYSGHLLLVKPAYWVFPLQTLICAAALLAFWKYYTFESQRFLGLAVGVGLGVFLLWVSPQIVFDQPKRFNGFDPTIFKENPVLYLGTVLSRFARLIIVVPLIEEIFWRGFLQRYLINERFHTVPIGQYSHFSFWGVVIGFTLVHSPSDYLAAFLTAIIYGWLTVHTKSLLTPIIAHATTNLALGIYIMETKQWGFW